MAIALALGTLAIFLAVAMAGAWLIVDRSGRSGWADTTWSLAVGVGGVAAALAPISTGTTARQLVVAALVAVWSLRLSGHIAARTRSGGEDPRYQALKEEWGQDRRKQLFWFLQIQAAAAFLLVVTILVAAHNPAPWPQAGDIIGMVIAVAAVLGETVADRQLARFRENPANQGKVCDVGLWGQSRHPNYFFEWLGWVAYAVIAIDIAGGYPWGWLALAGPIFVYWLLVHVSGIPPLEAHMLRSRGDAFRAYQARVSAFWPLPGR
ncbi:MAG: DUF1295 domain-containing protein [Amaricoccus sp.]